MTNQHTPPTITRVLVPLGGTAADQAAIQMACEQARKNKAQVFVIYVIEVERALALGVDLPQELAKGERILSEAESTAKTYQYQVETEILQAREVGPTIVDEANQRNVDLIVMGLPYKHRFGEFSLGETVPYVLRYAPCRVWVCRDTETTSEGH